MTELEPNGNANNVDEPKLPMAAPELSAPTEIAESPRKNVT